jgi:hypothetical protein
MSLRRKPIETFVGLGTINNGVVGLAEGFTCAFSGQKPIVTQADVRNTVDSILRNSPPTQTAAPQEYCTCEADAHDHDFRCKCSACCRRRRMEEH